MERVIARAPQQGVVSKTRREAVVAFAAINQIIAIAAGNRIAPDPTRQHICASAAEEDVIPFAAVDAVIPFAPIEKVIATLAHDHIRSETPKKRVITVIDRRVDRILNEVARERKAGWRMAGFEGEVNRAAPFKGCGKPRILIIRVVLF